MIKRLQLEKKKQTNKQKLNKQSKSWPSRKGQSMIRLPERCPRADLGCVRLTLFRNTNTDNDDRKSLIKEFRSKLLDYETALKFSCVSDSLENWPPKFLKKII